MQTKYETLVLPNLPLIERWAREGLTDKQIAKNLGIAYSTFREYAKQFSALSASLKREKAVVNAEVENALLKRALGYDYEEVTKERNATGELVVTKIVKKQVVPDVTAQIYWLKNREPLKWRDRVDISGEVEHKVDVPQNVQKLSPEALRAIAGGIVAPSTEEFGNGNGET